jgi:hypothetical protein
MPLGRGEQRLAVIESLDQLEAWEAGPDNKARQSSLALDQGQTSNILAVAAQNVEGEDNEFVYSTGAHRRPQAREVRKAVIPGQAQLGIEYLCATRKGLQGLCQGRQAPGPIMAATAVEPYGTAFLADLQAIAVHLGLVQPSVAGGHSLGRDGIAGTDELRRRRGHTQVVGEADAC